EWVAPDGRIVLGGFVRFTGTAPGGGLAKLYDFTITGADKASIDTFVDGPGAGLLDQTHDVLEIWILARTDDAGATAAIDVTVNNDTGANYDLQQVVGVAAAASAGTDLGNVRWQLNAHGSGGGASYAALNRVTIPGYAVTTFFKTGEVMTERPDSTAANNLAAARSVAWKNT